MSCFSAERLTTFTTWLGFSLYTVRASGDAVSRIGSGGGSCFCEKPHVGTSAAYCPAKAAASPRFANSRTLARGRSTPVFFPGTERR